MPPNMMKALMGSSRKVTGSKIATVRDGPMPGRTPTAVPRVTPISAHPRWGRVSAFIRPWPSAWSVSIALGKRELQQMREEQISGSGDAECKGRVAFGMTWIECAGRAPEKRCGGRHEAGALHQRKVDGD